MCGISFSKKVVYLMKTPFNELEPNQQKLIAFMAGYVSEHQFSPSVRDIVEGVEEYKSTSLVIADLRRLVKHGHIATVSRNHNRNRRVTKYQLSDVTMVLSEELLQLVKDKG